MNVIYKVTTVLRGLREYKGHNIAVYEHSATAFCLYYDLLAPHSLVDIYIKVSEEPAASIFWAELSLSYSEDRGTKFFQNFGIYIPDYTESHARRHPYLTLRH
jgi:hypothetical protein